MSSTTLSSHIEHVAAKERRSSIQALLRRPLITAEGDRDDDLTRIRRHRRFLAKWFLAELGYRLIVDSDFARLQKVGLPSPAQPRGLTMRTGRPFTPRHYVLLSLLLASLDREGSQTTLARLAEDVALRARLEIAAAFVGRCIPPSGVARLRQPAEGLTPPRALPDGRIGALGATDAPVSGRAPGAPEIPGFTLDFDQVRDRRAFVHAAHALADLGVLRRLDGDEERFARGEEGADALYRVHHRRLGQLLSSPAPPSAADRPDDLQKEHYPETNEGRNRRIRHGIMRALVEEAVLYFSELDPESRAYLRGQRARIFSQVEEAAGLVLELRAEGVVSVDPAARVTDRPFPGIGTVAHAALLAATEISGRLREGEGTLAVSEIGSMIRGFAEEYGRYWSAEFTGAEDRAKHLADRVLDLLERFRLVSRRGGVVTIHPAIARFAAEAPSLSEEETE